MKLKMPLGQEIQFKANVNQFLPPDVRVFDVKRVTKSFNAKIACSSRRYQYLFPTYLLQDKNITNELLSSAPESNERLSSVWKRIKSFRATAETLNKLKETLKAFEGTKKYHNFTSQKSPSDASAARYIMSFTCEEPSIWGEDEVEWICISVVGQSFLLNQIRKMVALIFEVVRGSASQTTISEAFSDSKVNLVVGSTLYAQIFSDGDTYGSWTWLVFR